MTSQFTLEQQLFALNEQLVLLEQVYRSQSERGTLDRETAEHRYRVLRSVRDTLRYVHLSPTPADYSAAQEWVLKAEGCKETRKGLLLTALENASLSRRIEELESQIKQDANK